MKYSMRVTARHDGREVVHEHDGVERVAAQAAADEKRAALAQEAADHRHVEVDAGGDVRNRVAVPVDRVGQQQVVHVAAVAGHVDDLVALGGALQRLDVRELARRRRGGSRARVSRCSKKRTKAGE